MIKLNQPERKEGTLMELHCHTIYSNYNNSGWFPMDCSITPRQLLDALYAKGIDAVFITDHNTLEGVKQTIAEAKVHEKFKNIRVYPGIEISASLPNHKPGHVSAYGINEAVRQGLPVKETILNLKDQGAVTLAPHPYAVYCAIRDTAKDCDLIEGFNSQNADIDSNVAAHYAAEKWKKFETAGSDAHLESSIGSCLTRVKAENNLEDILNALRRGQFNVEKVRYTSAEEYSATLCYMLSEPAALLGNIRKSYGGVADFVEYIIKKHRKNPDAWWVAPVMKLIRAQAKGLSMKVNLLGYPEELLTSSWGKRIYASFSPPSKNASLDSEIYSAGWSKINNYNYKHPEFMINTNNRNLQHSAD